MRLFVLWRLGFACCDFARLGLLGFALLCCASLAHAAPFISLGDPPKYRDTSTFKAFDYTNPNAKKGGTLKAYALGSFSTLNAFSLEESAAGLELVYDTLMAQSMDEPYAQYALVASDVAIAPNHKSVIFTINPKARFSDGRAISAQDVGFSFDMIRQNPLYKQYYADISGYEILDSRRIKFLFTTSENKELPLILGQLSILPRHYYVRDGQNSYGKDPLQLPLGSGAYKLTRYEVGKLVEYRRDKNYWAENLPSRKGQFNFDVVRYEYYRDDTAALQGFLRHKYDFRIESAAKVWANGYRQSKDSAFSKLEIPHSLPSGMQGFFINLRKAPFDDPLVRRAMILAFNFEWSNENLFFSQYQRTTSFFNHSIFASTPSLSSDQLELLRVCKVDPATLSRLQKPYTIPTAPSLQDERENLKKARDLLRQAGYVVQNNQAYKNGIPLRFTLLLDNPAFERLAIRYARNLARLGITMEIQKLDSSQYANRVKSFDYEMIVGIIPQSLSPGNEQRYFFGSLSADTQGSRNYSGVKSVLVDCLIDRLINAPDRDSLVLATRTLDRVLLELDIVVPHYFLPSFRLAIWDNIAMPKVQPLYDISPTLWWDRRKSGF
ncbi:oligopeptide ABC transporter, periplasmic oligopeptide-binding protein OppA [Helicobacter canis]|uniref:Oligopeptide ABC transporter, periplasmic oligopeptide-binding protein OppA n=1 Tax=Helicobacter canis TaxID=29419 RepID=A0A377J3N6_9HELI|nr:oligopeptide ABC transporter, periplasmic oligopeptide-binding protein OppA [Helicobacter canis]